MNLKHLPLRWSKIKEKTLSQGKKNEQRTGKSQEPREDWKRIQLLNAIRSKINITQSYLSDLLRWMIRETKVILNIR